MTNIEYLKQVLQNAKSEILSLIDQESDLPPSVEEIDGAIGYLAELEKPNIILPGS